MFMINILTLIIPILLTMTFLTLIKQKILNYMQFQKNPNIMKPYNLLQPITNTIKLFIKKPLQPTTSSISMFILTPILTLTLTLTM